MNPEEDFKVEELDSAEFEEHEPYSDINDADPWSPPASEAAPEPEPEPQREAPPPPFGKGAILRRKSDGFTQRVRAVDFANGQVRFEGPRVELWVPLEDWELA